MLRFLTLSYHPSIYFRMEDLNILDAAFLNGFSSSTPTLGVICKEPNNKLSFKAYETDHRSKELVQILWKKDIFDTQAFIIPGRKKNLISYLSFSFFFSLVPEPCLGALVIGTETIYYFHNNNNNEQIQIAPSVLKVFFFFNLCSVVYFIYFLESNFNNLLSH